MTTDWNHVKQIALEQALDSEDIYQHIDNASTCVMINAGLSQSAVWLLHHADWPSDARKLLLSSLKSKIAEIVSNRHEEGLYDTGQCWAIGKACEAVLDNIYHEKGD